MPAERYGSQPSIELDGQPLPADVESALRQVVVDSDTLGPDACRIVIEDPERDALDRAGFQLHARLTVKAARSGEGTPEQVFDGRVFSVGFSFDDQGAAATVVAYDNSYALFSGRHTTTYPNVTDSAIAERLAKQVGLRCGTIDDSKVTHNHVSQLNETHWEFLTRRARELDWVVRVRGDRLDFVRSTSAADAPEPGEYDSQQRLQLTPGGNLESFTARVTAAQQATEIEVRGWDPVAKDVPAASVPAATRCVELPDRPDGVAPTKANGSPVHVAPARPLATLAEVEAVAAAEAERIASTFVHAEGVAWGDPAIMAGAAVSIGKTGGRFDGKYTVSRARHVFGRSGYRTEFRVTGRHDRSVFGLVTGHSGDAAPALAPRPLGSGPVIGIVSSVGDEEHLGEVKLLFPWLEDSYESDWARVVQIGAGADRGLLWLPEPDDEVLVAFEHGDPRRPYVLGGLYNGVDRPPFSGVVGQDGQVQQRGLRSRNDHRILVVDAPAGEERIELQTREGKVKVVLDHKNGKLILHADGDMVLEADGAISLKAKGDLALEADGKGTIKANGLTIDGNPGNVDVKGSKILLNS